MNSHEARAILGSFFGSIFSLVGFVVLFVIAIGHLGVSAAFTDLKYCGVAETTAIWFGLLIVVSPVFAWLAFMGTIALGFDDGAAPFVVGALVLAAIVGNEVWLVSSKISARQNAAEIRRGFGGELELSRKLFRESAFCRVHNAVL